MAMPHCPGAERVAVSNQSTMRSCSHMASVCAARTGTRSRSAVARANARQRWRKRDRRSTEFLGSDMTTGSADVRSGPCRINPTERRNVSRFQLFGPDLTAYCEGLYLERPIRAPRRRSTLCLIRASNYRAHLPLHQSTNFGAYAPTRPSDCSRHAAPGDPSHRLASPPRVS